MRVSRIPTAAWICALLAFLNAACWSLLTPPFQVWDEPAHFAYVQQLAETESLPDPNAGEYSLEETVALRDLRHEQVRTRPVARTISSRAQQRTLEGDLSQPLSRRGPGGAGFASSEPPLYYALQTIPYALGSSGTILDRLELMRLLSALMGALTALFAFLFLREALPGVPWAWTVGGLGVALAPLLGFMSGAVNPDAMLFAVSAALFYCLARAFRRGLTQRLAIATGAVIAIGFLTKLNFVGLAPGAILGLILLARRQARSTGRSVYYRALAPALLIALSPGMLYGLVNVLSSRPALGIVSGEIEGLTGGQTSISHELSYIWQFFLPPLPWMHNYFVGIFTTRQIWFDGLIGRYGWGDTVFPGWVYTAALLPAGLIGALCVRELAIGRTALRRRTADLIVYAAMGLGVLVLVGASGYPEASIRPAEFAQPRYLLPMLALWGAGLALAARGAGRRWGPVAGALIVVLVLTHDIFSQLQLIARYYG
jgi:4-amino-4-deoxy-L-arabinose transferase-like glycosyltransferase